jgi:hypothetical protein
MDDRHRDDREELRLPVPSSESNLPGKPYGGTEPSQATAALCRMNQPASVTSSDSSLK